MYNFFNTRVIYSSSSFPFSWVHAGELLFTGKTLEGKKTYSTASLARALCLWPFTFMSMSPFKPLLPPSRWRARYRRIKENEKENKKDKKRDEKEEKEKRRELGKPYSNA